MVKSHQVESGYPEDASNYEHAAPDFRVGTDYTNRKE